MKQNKNSNDYTRNILNNIRMLDESTMEKGLLIEETEKSKGIAITDDPKFGQSVLSNQIDQFKASVDGGAQFAKPTLKVSDCPLIYLPSTGNLVFSGVIPRLNNLKFQFVLRTSTGNGCFIWSDGLILSNENLKTLQKLYGYYINWQTSWESSYADLEALDNMTEEQ